MRQLSRSCVVESISFCQAYLVQITRMFRENTSSNWTQFEGDKNILPAEHPEQAWRLRLFTSASSFLLHVTCVILKARLNSITVLSTSLSPIEIMEPLRFAFAFGCASGHINPSLAVTRRLVQQGHEAAEAVEFVSKPKVSSPATIAKLVDQRLELGSKGNSS